MDRYLDTARTGPLWLARDEIASLVAAEFLGCAGIEVHAWVILANHVHLLFSGSPEILAKLKGRTASQANILLSLTGQAFWQAESYDHWVRNEAEFKRIVKYIEDNPVKAGLVPSADRYRWSSAWSGL